MKNSIDIKNLTKKYDGFMLDNITFSLPTGCILGFIGENGSGKSTTIKLILDLIKKDSGEIKVLDTDLRKAPKSFKENIGVVIDESCFPENLNLKEIEVVLKNIYKTWNHGTFERLIDEFKLPIKKPIKEYSKGMKMKLSIAIALSHNAKILILDEATSGLDPIVRNEILDIFLEFMQDETHSILISSHIISDLEKVCDYITLIHNGRLVFCEQKDDLLNNYGILKCSKAEFDEIDKDIVKGFRQNSFGVEALVDKQNLTANFVIDKATIEDIMLYSTKEEL